jgi:predicted transcriptional regulator
MNDTRYNPLQEHLTTVLSDLIREREEKSLTPLSVSMTDIQHRLVSDVKEELNRMVKDGILTFHRTVNDVTFEFTPPK